MRALRPAVGGCEYAQPNDPGNLQLDWLEVQLDVFRNKGISVSTAYTIFPVSDTGRGLMGFWRGADRSLPSIRYG